MNSRKEARHAIAGLLSAGIAEFEAVYPHSILDPGGLSPIATVESDGTAPSTSFSPTSRRQSLIISLLWVWTDATEDEVDDLSDAVLDLIDENSRMEGVYDALLQDPAFSESGYTDPIEGIVYRVERIRVTVE